MSTFKLTLQNVTRRVVFPDLPSWIALASKIQSLYDIPIDKVGVSYIDADGDEVTFSSEDELQDFYATTLKPPQTIKLSVQHLGSVRDSHLPLSSALGSATSHVQSQANYRNTFGQDGMVGFPDEDDWQTVPPGGLFNILGSDTFGGPQAHIEQLSSNAGSVIQQDDPDSDMSSFTTEKGKGKAVADDRDDVSTTGSVLVSEANVKYPVHVLDVADEGMLTPTVDTEAHKPGETTLLNAESTPATTQESLKDEKVVNDDDADPPLPSLDSAPRAPSVPAPSLTNDIASFLSTLTTVFSSHPELSEGLRNISRNAANGTYWSAHREAVSRAAEDIRRSVVEESGRAVGDYRRVAEEEAGRRVADALGGLMQMFGEMRTDIQDADANRAAQPDPTRNINDPSSSNANAGNPFARHPHGPPRPQRRPFTWADGPPGGFPFAPPPGPPPPGAPGGPGPGPHGGPHHHGRFPGPPPPPPPPGPFPPFDQFGPKGSHPWGGPFWAHDAEHRHGRGGRHHGPGRWGRDQSHSGDEAGRGEGAFAAVSRWAGPDSAAARHVAGWVGVGAPGPSNETARATGDGTTDPAELRAKVEEAKQKYKMEKEAYRRARGERKYSEMHGYGEKNAALQEAREVVQDAKNIAKPVPPPGITQIVSNARGPYPELEMVSVPGPHRAATHRRTASSQEQEAQSMRRITRRIADMGFTEMNFPLLPGRIRDLLTSNKPTTKEAEDDVVTTLLEEMLAAPQPSTSAAAVRPNRENVPGAWN
ncbi:hypothetical protein HWV62_21236 [Athelia sp. TMB]|nr:hypothetical protein HWV62_21236 [Athelia sp. TMB]